MHHKTSTELHGSVWRFQVGAHIRVLEGGSQRGRGAPWPSSPDLALQVFRLTGPRGALYRKPVTRVKFPAPENCLAHTRTRGPQEPRSEQGPEEDPVGADLSPGARDCVFAVCAG